MPVFVCFSTRGTHITPAPHVENSRRNAAECTDLNRSPDLGDWCAPPHRIICSGYNSGRVGTVRYNRKTPRYGGASLATGWYISFRVTCATALIASRLVTPSLACHYQYNGRCCVDVAHRSAAPPSLLLTPSPSRSIVSAGGRKYVCPMQSSRRCALAHHFKTADVLFPNHLQSPFHMLPNAESAFLCSRAQ